MKVLLTVDTWVQLSERNWGLRKLCMAIHIVLQRCVIKMKNVSEIQYQVYHGTNGTATSGPDSEGTHNNDYMEAYKYVWLRAPKRLIWPCSAVSEDHNPLTSIHNSPI